MSAGLIKKCIFVQEKIEIVRHGVIVMMPYQPVIRGFQRDIAEKTVGKSHKVKTIA